MIANALVIVAAIYGIDVGWQPTGDGQLEYIIQVEPQLLEAMREGQAITSEIPPEVRGVRRYRIVVGNDELPRIGQAPDAAQVPLPFEPDDESMSIRQATGQEEESSSESGPAQHTDETDLVERAAPEATAESKPWMTLILISLGLFASVGGNIYFLWITWDTRRRYRALVQNLAGSH